MDRKKLLKERDNTTSNETKIPLVLTYNRSLTNIRKVVRKHWNISSINKSFKGIFPFYNKELLEEKIFGLKRCIRHTLKYWIKSLVLNKKTPALFLNVQLHQCHRSHITQVKFHHNHSKTIWRHIHLVKFFCPTIYIYNIYIYHIYIMHIYIHVYIYKYMYIYAYIYPYNIYR